MQRHPLATTLLIACGLFNAAICNSGENFKTFDVTGLDASALIEDETNSGVAFDSKIIVSIDLGESATLEFVQMDGGDVGISELFAQDASSVIGSLVSEADETDPTPLEVFLALSEQAPPTALVEHHNRLAEAENRDHTPRAFTLVANQSVGGEWTGGDCFYDWYNAFPNISDVPLFAQDRDHTLKGRFSRTTTIKSFAIPTRGVSNRAYTTGLCPRFDGCYPSGPGKDCFDFSIEAFDPRIEGEDDPWVPFHNKRVCYWDHYIFWASNFSQRKIRTNITRKGCHPPSPVEFAAGFAWDEPLGGFSYSRREPRQQEPRQQEPRQQEPRQRGQRN